MGMEEVRKGWGEALAKSAKGAKEVFWEEVFSGRGSSAQRSKGREDFWGEGNSHGLNGWNGLKRIFLRGKGIGIGYG